jgi:very-short-patch-repair endonuclease
VHHRGASRVGDISRLDDHWITAPARNAMETAVITSRDPAVAVIDWFLNRRLATPAECAAYVDPLMREWAGSVDLGGLLRLARPKRCSVGESRTGLFLNDWNYPEPECQWVVHRLDGRIAGIVDFVLHAERFMIEFDGQVKYGRLLKPGQSVTEVIMAERARERLLEDLTGYQMFRVVWSELDDPRKLDARLRAAIATSQRLRAS